jgi:hypothetical protein
LQHRLTLAAVKSKKPTGCAGRLDLTHEVLPEREDGQIPLEPLLSFLAQTRFSNVFLPPRARAMMWSRLPPSRPTYSPEYWQTPPSRTKMASRETRASFIGMLGWFGGYGFSGTMGFFTGTMHIPALFAFL